MEIVKILNNNAALVRGDSDSEMVIMGKGVAFGKRSGDVLPDDTDCKRFVLSDRETTDKFSQLIGDLPPQVVYTSEKIINFGKIKLGHPLSDRLYLTLTDHIASVVDRYAKGIQLRIPILDEVRRFYPQEYQVGEKAVQIIRRDLQVELLPDEIAFIALHFVNAQTGGEQNIAYQITEIMQKITGCVRDYFHLEYDESSMEYYRFVNHVKFFAQRLLQKTGYPDDNVEVYEAIRKKHPKAFACTREISKMLRADYDYDLGKEETLYLTIHIARIIQNL